MESSPDITVVTSITGGKDALLEGQPRGARYLAFCDQEQESPTWEVLPAYDRFLDPRRNSRIHKMLIDRYAGTEYSIWIDGNIRLLTEPKLLIEQYLKDHDIAVYRHPVRDCIYDEALVCAQRNLDDPETIIAQVKRYEDEGYGKRKGLNECGVIFRRHTPRVIRFNELWWSEYCVGSRRDQLSFPVAAERAGLRVNSIPDYFVETSPTRAVKQSGDVEIVTHRHFS